MNIKKADEVAKEIFDLLRKCIYDTEVSTVGTMVFIPAVLADAYKFRTFGFYSPNLKPGAIILSEEANIESPKLFDILASILFQKFRIKIKPERMVVHTPIKEMDNIAKKNGLDIEESIMACLLVCATIINNICDIFDIYTSIKIAVLDS